MPKVSFILPAYKRRFLHEAIASILAQTYRDFELVVVDDCSPENLKEVVDEFHDERLTYHRNEKNIGGKDLVAAWNHAMEYARGEWCVLASDDDVYSDQCLERLMSLVEKYPTCDLFHARGAIIDGSGSLVSVTPSRPELESQLQMIQNRGVFRFDQWAADFMFRISAFKAQGGFVRFPLAWFTDEATWMLLSRNGCAHTSEVLFNFRFSGLNISDSHDALVLEKIIAGAEFVKWFEGLLRPIRQSMSDKAGVLYVDQLLRRTVERVNDLAVSELTYMVSFMAWAKALNLAPLSKVLKHKSIYRRFPIVLFLRTLISFRKKRR